MVQAQVLRDVPAVHACVHLLPRVSVLCHDPFQIFSVRVSDMRACNLKIQESELKEGTILGESFLVTVSEVD